MNYEKAKWREVVEVAARLYGAGVDEIMRPTREPGAPQRRQAAMLAVHLVTGLGESAVARCFGVSASAVRFAKERATRNPLLMEDAMAIAAEFSTAAPPAVHVPPTVCPRRVPPAAPLLPHKRQA